MALSAKRGDADSVINSAATFQYCLVMILTFTDNEGVNSGNA
jgi:hypothetical protein